MKKRKQKAHRLWMLRNPLVVLGVCISILAAIVIIALPGVARRPQTLTDAIMGFMVSLNINKSGEIFLFWACLLLGMVILCVLSYKRTAATNSLTNSHEEKSVSHLFIALSLLVIPNIFRFFIHNSISFFWFFLAVVYVYVYFVCQRKAFKAVLLAGLVWHCLIAVFSLIALAWPAMRMTAGLFDMISIIFSSFLIYKYVINKSEPKLDRLLMYMQCAVPFSLLIYLQQRYLYNGEYIYVRSTAGYVVFISILLFSLVVFSAIKTIHLCKENNPPLDENRLIFVSTVITFVVINSFAPFNRLFPFDWHHIGERIEPYYQVVNFGQRLYSDIIPSSGLFPMVQGFIHHLFTDGTSTAINEALVIWGLIVAIITVVLIYINAGSRLTFYISLFFFMPQMVLHIYERHVLLLPFLLVLATPKLIKNRNRWLQCWMMFTFLAVMYYPVTGGALLLSGLPFGMVQIVMYIRSGQFVQELKTPGFYISWILCFIPVVFAIPLLVNIADYILIQAGQTTVIDGLPIYGFEVPGTFISFVPFDYIRQLLFYGFRFSIELLAPLLFFYMIVIFFIRNRRNLIESIQSPLFYSLTAGFIAILVSYTQTLVRADRGVFVSRSYFIIFPIVGVFFVLALWRYGETLLPRRYLYILIGFSVGFVMMIRPIPMATNNITGAIAVPQDFIQIDDDFLSQVPRAGAGFIRADQRDTLLRLNKLTENYQMYPFRNLPVGMLAFQTLDLRASGTLFQLPGGMALQEKIVERMAAEPPILYVFDNPIQNYRIFRWLIDSGYNRAPSGLFMPAEMVSQYYGIEIDDQRFLPGAGQNLGYRANALGRSINTLLPLFEHYKDLKLNASLEQRNIENGIIQSLYDETLFLFTFEEPVYGRDADFLLLKIDYYAPRYEARLSIRERIINYFSHTNPSQTVHVSWEAMGLPENINSLSAVYLGCGNLLVPLGVYPSWLLSDNQSLQITLADGFAAGSYISIREAQLLRLVIN